MDGAGWGGPRIAGDPSAVRRRVSRRPCTATHALHAAGHARRLTLRADATAQSML
jgi:hypothetical protein